MIIKNKNIYYRTYAAFTADKNAGNIPNTAVVYIADRKIIYTNGVEFGMTASEDEVSKAYVSKDEHVITDEDGNPEVDEHGVEKKYTGTDLVFTDNDGNIAAQLTINPYRNILSVTDNNGHTGSMYLPQLRFDGYSLQATYDNWENVITLSTLNPSIRIKKFVSEIPRVNDTDTLDCEAGDIIAVGEEGNWKIYSLAEVKTGQLTTEYEWKYVADLGANI
jgi:hypothetical protein